MKRIQILMLLAMLSSLAVAQLGSEPNIQRRLEMIEKGQSEAVRAELSTLMTTYQNNPGVMYLQAVLTTDGAEAAKIYQNIVDNFPRNEWGDDALYKLYQYYYAIGLYKTAEQKLSQLKQEYPFSAYAADSDGAAAKKPVPKEEKPLNVKPQTTVQKFATGFTVQVGAFSTMQNAEELKTRFEKEKFLSNIFTMVTKGKKLHKVWVGEFQTYDEAKKISAQIKSKFGLSSIVVSR